MVISREMVVEGGKKGDHNVGLRFPYVLVELQFSCIFLHSELIVINERVLTEI